MADNALHCEQWPIDRPQPFPQNARVLSPVAIDKLAASIKAFGFRQPIVCDAHDVIVVGHTRLLAARKLELETVPVHVAHGLSPAQCRAYRLADNRTADETTWDLDLLEAEMRELQALDMAALTGFEAAQIAEMLKPPPGTEPDAVPDAPVTPVSRAGDLWLLGPHRVLCGDSTDGEAVARLMAGAKADMVFTDPPYGVKFERGKYQGNNHGKKFGAIANDALDGADLQAFMTDAFSHALTVAKDEASIYAWTGCSPKMAEGGAVTLRALIAAGWTLQSQIIWHKTPFVLGRSDYHWQHEAAWYGYKGANHAWYGGRNKGSVWDVPKPQAMDLHPTMKPIRLAEIACENSTQPGDLVLDLFGGSGSTLIACEKTGRAARLMELDAKYVDVIVARWQAFTGLTATLEGDTRTFAEIATERADAIAA